MNFRGKKRLLYHLCSGLCLTLGGFYLVACSTASLDTTGYTEDELLDFACRPGRRYRKTEGSIWMKAQTDEESGRFPAELVAVFPNRLDMEVTDLLGGRMALVKVRGKEYQVSRPGHRAQKGRDAWAGIPLQWAVLLMSGRIPCPKRSEIFSMERGDKGDLIVKVRHNGGSRKESYRFEYQEWNQKPWPSKVIWNREVDSESLKIVFEFADPHSKTGSPGKWSAVSELGEVHVSWREREFSQPVSSSSSE